MFNTGNGNNNSSNGNMHNHNQNFGQQQQQQQQQQQHNQLLFAAVPPPGVAHIIPENNSTGVGINNTNNNNPLATHVPQANSLLWQQALQSLNLIPALANTNHATFVPVMAAAGTGSGAVGTTNTGNGLSVGTTPSIPSLALYNPLGMANAILSQQQFQSPTQPPMQVAALHALNNFATSSQVLSNAASLDADSSKRKQPPKITEQSRDQFNNLKAKYPKVSNLTSSSAALIPKGMMNGTAPSVVSSSYSSACDVPPIKLSDAELAALTPAERRRYERNLREQQRSYRISQQIKQLRDVLTSGNVPFKPNKFSILVCVANYIKELQSRAIMLDADHKRLVDTIRQTSAMVASGQIPSSEDSNSGDINNSCSNPSSTSLSSAECSPDYMLVHGVNYQAVFEKCPYPLGVSSLDGRILACNASFERLLGCPERGEMHQQSLFLYIRNHQEIFEAMADLLKRSSIASETGEDSSRDNIAILYWCGQVVSSRMNSVRPLQKDSVFCTGSFEPRFFAHQ